MNVASILWPTVATALYVGAAVTRSKHRLPPLLVAAAVLAAGLLVLQADRETYRAAIRPFAWLLGPQVVALAVPLERERRRGGVPPESLPLLAGSALVGVLATLGTLRAFHAGKVVERTIAPRAATSALSIPTASALGGSPSLAALAVALSGLGVAVVGPWVLTRLGTRSPLARGLALGSAGHLAATASAYEESAETGAAASYALVVHGVLTTAVVWLLRACAVL